MTFEQLRPLLRWGRRKLLAPPRIFSPEALRAYISDVPYQDVPKRLYPLLVGFRHRRQDMRLAVCQRYFRGCS